MHDKTGYSQTGSIMITVLAMLVLISLGAGIVMMFSTSALQMAENNVQLRAASLSEAGFRYAAGEYRFAGNLSAKFDRLETLHDEEVTLLDNDGSFQLSVQSYWFVTTNSYSINDTRLSLKVLGKFPDHFETALPTTGKLKINYDFYTYTAISTAHGAGFNSDQAVLTITPGLKEDISANTSVQLVFAPPGTQTVTRGGDITISTGNALKHLFPEKNGLIQIFKDEDTESGTYKYKERQQGSIILSGITPVKDGELPLNINTGSRVVIKKQAKVLSTGSLGTGKAGSTKKLALSVFLTDEEFIPADTPQDMDLGKNGSGTQDIFNDEDSNGHTKLKNWEFDGDSVPESEKLTVTTQTVVTDFGASSNYVTFQNFSEIDTDKGYTAELIDKKRLPASVRSKKLNGIWGNASNNIYFVGEDGTILHFNGQTFNLMASNTREDLNAIWGLPASKTSAAAKDKIFVVGDKGKALVNEGRGAGWQTARHKDKQNIYAAWGTAWNHFDGYGEKGTNPYHWNDGPATQLDNYSFYKFEFKNRVNFRGLWAIKYRYPYYKDYSGWGYSAYQNIMVGEFAGGRNDGDGIIMHEFYLPAVIIPDTPLRGVWGSSFSNIYAVGNGGAIYHHTSGNAPDYNNSNRPKFKDSWQGKWKQILPGDIPTTQNLNGVFGNNARDFYVIGDNGTILYNKGQGFELVPTTDVTTETLNSIWGSDRTGIYAVGNNGTIVFLGYPENKIGGHMLPLSKNDIIARKWAATSKFLSYSIQTKIVWGDDLDYGASGINFRWHNVSSGKYAGYGVSFVRYDPSNDAAGYNDMVPDAIKPEFHGTAEKHDRLLVVVWEQYVQGGAEHRRWVAYKDITNDKKMVKADGTPVDLASLIVRVHEKKIEGLKVNDINIYYGNASIKNQGYDKRYNNTVRNEYNPSFGKNSDIIKWPVFELDDWTRCPNPAGSNTVCETADSFTLVDNVTVAIKPVKPAGTALDPNLWIINPASDLVVLKNSFTIRSARFTSPSGTSFGNQSDRSEIGLHVFGDIGDNTSNNRVSFTDFAVQLGVGTDAVNTESSFGTLQ